MAEKFKDKIFQMYFLRQLINIIFVKAIQTLNTTDEKKKFVKTQLIKIN